MHCSVPLSITRNDPGNKLGAAPVAPKQKQAGLIFLVLFFKIILFIFFGSWATPDGAQESLVAELRKPSLGCWGLNPGRPQTGKAPTPLYHPSGQQKMSSVCLGPHPVALGRTRRMGFQDAEWVLSLHPKILPSRCGPAQPPQRTGLPFCPH